MKTSVSSQLFLAAAPLLAIGICCLQAQDSEDKEDAVNAVPWSQTDTRLANHYIQLLQKDPAYGNVLNLLWDLYRKKDQTPLLLDYFEKASASGGGVPLLIYAHLLRKDEQLEEARDAYDAVLDLEADNPHALRALAEIADRQKRFGKALSLYNRLAQLVPVTEEDGIPMRLRKAALHRMQGQKEEAVATWNELLATFPSRVDLRTQIVSLLLEAGETDSALGVLQQLAESSDPREKLDALTALTRLYEFISDFDGATKSARRGLTLLHYKNHDYAELFAQLVQIHERFEKLPELEESLRAQVEEANPTEQALYELAEFYRITADPQKEEAAVAALVERIPGDLEYRIRLVGTRMRNDRYGAAAETLESALAKQGEVPLHLILLRADIALGAENPVEAEEVVKDYIAEHDPSTDEIREIIEYARSNYLDKLVEQLLREKHEDAVSGSDGVSAPIELARFLHERGRKKQAYQTLDQFADTAGGATLEKARRLHQVSMAYRDLGEEEKALQTIDQAIALAEENEDFLTTRADLLVEAGEVNAAVSQLEALWHLGESYDEKSDIDQRLFSLLRGHYSSEEAAIQDNGVLNNGNIQSLAQYRRLAAAASRVNRPGDEPPPEELMAYYEAIKKTANDAPASGHRYRAAWWAFKLQDNQECFQQLNKANEEAGKPILEVEQMLLDLAVQNERPTLMVRHLTNLAKIDPANADDYLQRRAEMRFELGFEDEAVRELKRLAAKPDASLNTLNTLAKVYQRQGSSTKQVEVWQNAYRNANVFEKRRIVKQLSTALIENGNPQAALEAQLELIERETDVVQRRKQLDTQLTAARSHFLLEWLLGKFRDLSQQNPFDQFYPEALARVHRAAGEDREAFESMKKAYYMSGRNEALLDELGELADKLGDLKSAIYYRRQLLAREEGSSLENWQTLIEMLEKDLRIGEADLLRKRLESRFGRDPEFLASLTSHYFSSGQFADAERTLSKLVELRNWDLEAQFQLGLLKQERGKDKEALALFEAIIAATDEIDYPEDLARRALPLIRTATLDSENRTISGHELDPFIFTIESYPFLGGDLQDEIAEAFQEPHPEFYYRPSETHLLRLRAIEEAASLLAGSGGAVAWLEKRLQPSLPLHERLWAARHAGDLASFSRLLEERPEPVTHQDHLLDAYCLMLAGDKERLLSWTKPDSERDGGRHPRSRYAVMAAFLLLKDAPEDPLRDVEAILRAFDDLPVHETVASHLFSELRKAGDYEIAYQVGSRLSEEPLGESGSFLFALSQVAGWAGHREERHRLLDRSLSSLHANSGSRVAGHFFTALTEKLSLLESDMSRAEFLHQLRSRTRESKELNTSDFFEREILISLAAHQYPQAIEQLDQLTQRQIDFIRPRTSDLDQVRYDQSQSWQRMNQILRYYTARIPVTSENLESYLAALSGRPLAPPTDESVLAEFEQFEIDRQLLALETKSGPERDALVDNLHRMLLEPDSSLELAKSLENRGFYREAIPVYRIEAMRKDRDYAPLQGLFEACGEALEPEPALVVINQINAREFPAPPGLNADYLSEQHARFLLLSRNIERLVPLSRAPSAGKGAPPITTTAHLPYQAALVEAYRIRGHDEALLRLLFYLRENGEIDSRQLLLGAEILEKRGDLAEALAWVNSIPLNQSEPKLERTAILRSASLHTALNPEQPDPVIDLARISLEQNPPVVTRKLAQASFEAGAEEEAVGILKLLRRRTSDPLQRSDLTAQILRLERKRGTNWIDLRSEWEAFFHYFVYEPNSPDPLDAPEDKTHLLSNAARFVSWLQSDTDDREGLLATLKGVPTPISSAWLRELLVGAANESLDATVQALTSDSEAKIAEAVLETLPSFGDEGKAIARRIVEDSAKPGTLFFAHEPVRQIAYFHRLGDRSRLLEVHENLMQEAESDLFHQTGLDKWYPTLTTRYELPRLFTDIDERDLAARLFDRYHERIGSYRWNHQAFLEDYSRFLIDESQFAEAEVIMKNICQKSLRVDLRLLLELYSDWGKLDEWEHRTADLHLSTGRIALLRDWRTALAEGREMVKYSDTW